MGKLLEALKQNTSIDENFTTMIRKGKSVSTMRDASGRFSRSGRSPDSREKKALQKTQSSDTEKQANKERKQRNTRKGTVASRERSQVSSIRTDPNFKRKESGLLGSLKSNIRGSISRYKNPAATARSLVRDLYQTNGIAIPDEMNKNRNSLRKAYKIMKKLRGGMTGRKGKRR